MNTNEKINANNHTENMKNVTRFFLVLGVYEVTNLKAPQIEMPWRNVSTKKWAAIKYLSPLIETYHFISLSYDNLVKKWELLFSRKQGFPSATQSGEQSRL